MSEQYKPDKRNLVPVSRRGLAPVVATNPLVSRALVDLARGSRIDLKHAVACYFRGTDWYTKSDYSKASLELDEAIRLFDEAIRFNPHNAFAYRHRGKALWWKNKVIERKEDLQANDAFGSSAGNYVDKAMKDFDEAIRLEPNNALAYVERGEAWLWGISREKGIEDLNEAIRIDPTNAGWRALRGLACLAEDFYDKAIQDFSEAIRLNAKCHDVLIVFISTEGQAFLYDGDCNPTWNACVRVNLYEELELAHFRRGEARSRYFERGVAWSEKGDYDKAIQVYNEGIRIDPTYAALYALRGNAWSDKGEYDKAIQDYDEAIRIDRKCATFHYNRGVAWSAEGDYDAAIGDFTEAISLEPTFALAYNGRGLAWSNKGDYDKAIQDYNEATRIDPTTFSTNFMRKVNALRAIHQRRMANLKAHSQMLQSLPNESPSSRHPFDVKGPLTREPKPQAEPQQPATESREDKPVISRDPVSELNLSLRTRKSLERLGIISLADLASRTAEELLAAKDFDETCLDEVREKLAQFNLVLRGD
jgi:tetratricopeptide (TPR) repeat protein